MALVYQLAVFIIVLQSVYTLKCYVLAADNSGAMVMTPADSANMTALCNSTVPCACGSYKIKCWNYNSACTTAESQQHTTKWIYILTMSSRTCVPRLGMISLLSAIRFNLAYIP
ncbi:hypothetical protein I4U23_004907 [Adineta vaga]|nr:hypothetical protein I4U23_004907 [Adineta vaga]